MTEVILEDVAEAEVTAAVEWYESKSEGVGLRFLDAINASLTSLPRRWPNLKLLRDYEPLGVRYTTVAKPWPYRLLIVEEKGALHVFAVAHNSREPGPMSAPQPGCPP
jgi:hypothetical protein